MRSILLRRGGALGDFLAIVPLIHLLKLRFPGIRVTVQCPARYIPLMRMIEDIDAIDEDSLPLWQWSQRSVPERIRGVWSMSDQAIVFARLSSDLAIMARHHFGERAVVVEPLPGESREWVYRHVAGILVPPPTETEWESVTPPLLCVRSGMSAGEPGRLVAHAGAGSTKKQWGAGRMREALDQTAPGMWPGVDWIVGPADSRDSVMSVMDRGRDRILEGFPLDRLAAAMSCATAFLGNDSGPAHLAGLLGLNGVVMFGQSDPRVWRPFSETLAVMGFDALPATVGAYLEHALGRFRVE